jgi:hypothetical protein
VVAGAGSLGRVFERASQRQYYNDWNATANTQVTTGKGTVMLKKLVGCILVLTFLLFSGTTTDANPSLGAVREPAIARNAVPTGAVIQAASCSHADVQAVIDVAQDGDTVLVPAGNCTWTQTVRLRNKALTLQGAGLDQTLITDMTGNAWDEPALWIEGLDGQRIRITGFYIRYGLNSTLQDYNGAIVVRGTSKEVRIDHCKFVDFWNRSIQVSGYTYGLIDHCVFQRTPQAVNGFQAINVSGDSNAAWERPLTLGSANAFYIEDNVFDFYDSGTAADSHSGGRYVFRMNTLRNGAMLNHGLDTTDRSSHSVEIYDNAFHREAYTFNIITIRGGTGVIFRNVITSAHSIDIPIIAQLYRSCLDYPSTHGVRCNGTNPIDGNQDPSGYPCKDQHGRTTGQVLSPIYLWNNTFNLTTIGMRIFDPWHCTNPGMTDHLKEGRDFYNGTYRPRYVPYPYPHPLTLPDYPGEQRALDLQGWAVVGQANLAWQAVTGAVAYRVLRDWDEAQAITTTATYYREAWTGPEHIYMVYALNGAGDILAAEGMLVATAELALQGTPADSRIHLAWTINTILPTTSTWQIDYQSQTGSAYLPITGIVSPTRAYTLTSLTNYVWYTVTLNAMLDATPFLTDTIKLMPTDRFVYLPLVLR